MMDHDVERIVDRYAGDALLAVVGSVRFTHGGDWEQSTVVIRRAVSNLRPALMVSGGADGVDTLAEKIGAEFGYVESDGTFRVFRPAVRQWDAPGGFKERNMRIAETCTHLLRVFCQSSRTYGSGWTADYAEKLGRSVKRFSPCADRSTT